MFARVTTPLTYSRLHMRQAFVILSLLLGSLDAHAATHSLDGIWVNQDPATPMTSAFAITEESDGSHIRLWGSCWPVYCNEGTTLLDVRSDELTGTLRAEGFEITFQIFQLPNDRLLLLSETKYKDPAASAQPKHAEIFVRQPHAADNDAVNTLKRVAEKYRTVRNAEFECEVGDSDQKAKSRRKFLISRPNKLRMEVYGAQETVIQLTDGNEKWTLFPDSQEYLLGTELPNWSPIDTYGVLDTTPGEAKVVGSERVAGVDCTVIALSNPNRSRRLCIDPKTLFVWKDMSTGIYQDSRSVKLTTTYSIARAVATLDGELFSFHPESAKAKPRLKQQEVMTPGQVAPDFALRDIKGQETTLSQFKGRPVLLVFWATWCVPCRDEMPGIELLYRRFKDKGLVVLVISDEDAQKQADFLENFGYSFTALVDSQKVAYDRYHVNGLPETVLIDTKGKVREYATKETSYESFVETLHQLGIR